MRRTDKGGEDEKVKGRKMTHSYSHAQAHAQALTHSHSHSSELSLLNLCNRMTCLGVHYMRVSQFVTRHSRYQCGTIAHALAAAIKTLLKVR